MGKGRHQNRIGKMDVKKKQPEYRENSEYIKRGKEEGN